MNKIRIIREVVKEKREKYFVEYCPADERNWLATLQLVYIRDDVDLEEVKTNIDEEFYCWIEKYPIPLMASAFDYSGNFIHFKDNNHTLNGFKNLDTGKIIAQWVCLKNDDFPNVQKTLEYQNEVYKHLQFKEFDSKKAGEEFIKNARMQKKIIYIYGTSVILFTVLVELVAMGVDWFNWVVIIFGWCIAAYKIGKLYGYIKPTQFEIEQEEKKRKMKHYFYHCELNPKDFNLLRSANFKNDEIRSIQEQYNKK